jgi:hypothetical protein
MGRSSNRCTWHAQTWKKSSRSSTDAKRIYWWAIGGQCRTRTCDLLLVRHVLTENEQHTSNNDKLLCTTLNISVYAGWAGIRVVKSQSVVIPSRFVVDTWLYTRSAELFRPPQSVCPIFESDNFHSTRVPMLRQLPNSARVRGSIRPACSRFCETSRREVTAWA